MPTGQQYFWPLRKQIDDRLMAVISTAPPTDVLPQVKINRKR